MGIYFLYVINKAGGLVFQQQFEQSQGRLENNEALRMASTFHALFSMSQQICPVTLPKPQTAGVAPTPGGIKVLSIGEYNLHCFITLTGVKFLVSASKDVLPADVEGGLKEIYRLYVDYVLKNPSYVLDNVIQCEKFSNNLDIHIQQFNKSH
eukprot:TRINITY_DN8626_c0_g2_i1.p2 TRINITY_DN8626_c0_g2~~TRINITY_DN8626_c0_g2_i1.p2  ORF type:complete len:152 (+),score=36.96 TRINITY_DN8626_c0_g2_i1:42-497(+)